MAEEEEAEEPTKEKETQVEEGDVRVATAAGKKAGERMTQKERKRKRLVAKLAKQLLFNTAYLLLVRETGTLYTCFTSALTEPFLSSCARRPFAPGFAARPCWTCSRSTRPT